jgi:hypothetical protein
MSDAQTQLDAFIDRAIKQSPIEARIIRKIVKALKEAGNPVVSVWDGEEDNPVKTKRDIMVQVFNLDQAHLYTKEGGYVFVVMGNEWDTLSDYSMSLEDALKPVNDYIMKYMK